MPDAPQGTREGDLNGRFRDNRDKNRDKVESEVGGRTALL